MAPIKRPAKIAAPINPVSNSLEQTTSKLSAQFYKWYLCP